MADVQIAVIDQQDTQIALAVPGVQGPIGLTGSVTIAQAGTAATPGIRFESDTNTGIYSPGADQLAVSTGGTGRLFVDASGNVGIGTTSPATALHVSTNQSSVSTFQTSGADLYLRLQNSVNTGGYVGYNSSALTLWTADAERLRIDSSGKVGIGTSSPAAALDIFGNLFFSAASPQIQFNAGGAIIRAPAANSLAFLSDSTNERIRIDSSGNVGIGTASPTTLLDVNADTVRVRTARTPASASATGATGEICWDANYIYVCTATNTWKRSALSTW